MFRARCNIHLLQAEEAKTRGTAVTRESFFAWKATFDKEMAGRQAREDEEKMKGMTPKEREEYKKLATRSTGQFFAHSTSMTAKSIALQAVSCSSATGTLLLRTTTSSKKERSPSTSVSTRGKPERKRKKRTRSPSVIASEHENVIKHCSPGIWHCTSTDYDRGHDRLTGDTVCSIDWSHLGD